MDTGIELAQRLLADIQASLLLRTSIPYLDILKDLAEGGATFSSATLNTSSNFGSFDTHLKMLLTTLNAANPVILNPERTHPLPLAAILDNLTANLQLLTDLFHEAIHHTRQPSSDAHTASYYILTSLEQINRSAV